MNSDVRAIVSRRVLRREASFFARMADLSAGTDDHALWCQIRDELDGYLAAVDSETAAPTADHGALFAAPTTPGGGRDP